MSVEAGRTPGQTHRTSYDAETHARLTADSDAIVARYPQARSALLPMLHLVQSEDGYVSPRGIAFCASHLGLTTAEVSAVATFYTQYKRHPNGDYTVGVCINTLCAVMGGDAIWEDLSDSLGIGHDETTEDGRITLERIECNAACDYAPVVGSTTDAPARVWARASRRCAASRWRGPRAGRHRRWRRPGQGPPLARTLRRSAASSRAPSDP
jgi:NADH-quinone oxidoreductase subunit E